MGRPLSSRMRTTNTCGPSHFPRTVSCAKTVHTCPHARLSALCCTAPADNLPDCQGSLRRSLAGASKQRDFVRSINFALHKKQTGHGGVAVITFPCCAAPPIQNLEAVSLGVVMTNSIDCSSYVACVSMPMTFEPCPSSVILQPAQDSAPGTVRTSSTHCYIRCRTLLYHTRHAFEAHGAQTRAHPKQPGRSRVSSLGKNWVWCFSVPSLAMVPAYTCQVLGPQHALALPNRQQHSSLSCNVPACSVCSGAVERHCKGHTTAQGEVDAGLDAEGIINRS